MGKTSNSLRPWAYLAGFSMSGFSLGLITCINTLLFLSRGLSLSLFSLAIGLNFITVMVLAFLGIPVLWLLLAAVFLLGSGFCGIYYQSRTGKAHKK